MVHNTPITSFKLITNTTRNREYSQVRMVDAISQPSCAECGASGLVLTDYRPYAFLRALLIGLWKHNLMAWKPAQNLKLVQSFCGWSPLPLPFLVVTSGVYFWSPPLPSRNPSLTERETAVVFIGSPFPNGLKSSRNLQGLVGIYRVSIW